MATMDLGAGASGWSQSRLSRVRALASRLVSALTGLREGGPLAAQEHGEENLAAARSFVEEGLRRHGYMDTSPAQLAASYRALNARLKANAQFAKAEALAGLCARLASLPPPEGEPEANYAVLACLLALADRPLESPDELPQMMLARLSLEEGATRAEEFGGGLGAPGEQAAGADGENDDDASSEAGSMGSWHYSELSGDEDLSDWSDDDAGGEEERWRQRREAELRAQRAAAEAEAARVETATAAAAAEEVAKRPPLAVAEEADEPMRHEEARPSGDGGAVRLAAALAPTLESSDSRTRVEEPTPTHTELDLVRQAVVMLRYGLPGSAFLAAADGRFVFAPGVHVTQLSHTALRAVLEPVMAAATKVKRLRKTCQMCIAPPKPGALCVAPAAAALASALQRALDATLAPTDALEIAAINPADEAGGEAAITALWLNSAVRNPETRLLERLGALEAASDAVGLRDLSLRGGARDEREYAAAVARGLSGLYELAELEWTGTGDAAGAYAMALFFAALRPYAEALHGWLHDGEDAVDGAFENQRALLFVRDAGEGEKADFWQRRFTVDAELCPAFLRPVAAEILEAGKSLHLLWDAPPRSADSEIEEEDIVALAERVCAPRETLADEMMARVDAAVATPWAVSDGPEADALLEHLGLDPRMFLDPAARCDDAREEIDNASGSDSVKNEGQSEPSEPAVSSVEAAPSAAAGAAVGSPAQVGLKLLQGAALVGSAATLPPWIAPQPADGAVAASYGVGAAVGAASAAVGAACAALRATAANTLFLPPVAARPTPSLVEDDDARRVLLDSPPSTLLADTLLAPLRARCASIAAEVCAAARGAWRVPQTFASLRAVYLCGAGDALHPFASGELFDRCRRPAALDDEAALSASLSTALAGSCHAEARDAADLVHARLRGGASGVTAAGFVRGAVGTGGDGGLEAINMLQVDFDVAWPASIVVDAAALAQYNAVMRLLLQLKLAHDSLAAVPVWAGEGAAEDGAAAEATGRRVARLRARLLHFVAALRTHVMSRALDGCWHALQSAMERATSLEAMRTAHEAYLTALARQCMIAPDRFWSLVSERVQKALRAAMAFAAAAGTMSDGYVTAGEVARALVAVDKAEEQFNEAIHYLLQVLQAKLKVGSFPALQELRDSIDYNGYERAKGALCEI